MFVPIISGLNERDIMDVLPKLVILPNARDAIDKIFSKRPAAILPQDFLVALHDLCPTKRSKNLEQVRRQCIICACAMFLASVSSYYWVTLIVVTSIWFTLFGVAVFVCLRFSS